MIEAASTGRNIRLGRGVEDHTGKEEPAIAQLLRQTQVDERHQWKKEKEK